MDFDLIARSSLARMTPRSRPENNMLAVIGDSACYAELKERRGRQIYRLKMLDTKGRVRDVWVDGKSGRLLRLQNSRK